MSAAVIDPAERTTTSPLPAYLALPALLAGPGIDKPVVLGSGFVCPAERGNYPGRAIRTFGKPLFWLSGANSIPDPRVSKRMAMIKSLYVGNLATTTTSDDLRELFAQYGTVKSANVMSDRGSGTSRGFGFVDMFNGSTDAIKNVNGLEFQGRTLVVNEARPPERTGGRRR